MSFSGHLVEYFHIQPFHVLRVHIFDHIRPDNSIQNKQRIVQR